MAIRRGWRWWSAAVPLIICQSSLLADAHIQLLYPLALSPNDYLTSLHTSGLCGEQRTGYDYSYVWQNWPFLNKNTTNLQAGTSTNITWSSVVDHVGGWRLELWDKNFTLAYSWDNQSHWGCNADGTARWANVTMPTQPCANCTLRLLRQAIDKSFGDNFTFVSCSSVNIVADDNPCNGCNGHGTCVQGSCQCDRSSGTGFWGGTHCEWEDECAADADCGQYGQCVDMGEGISYPPRYQCYCQNGYFGTAGVTASGRLPVRTCTRRSELVVSPSDARNWSAAYASQSLTNPNNTYTMFWKVQNQTATPYIEYAIWANTTNWVGQGLRPTANRSQANSQPTYTDVFPWLLPGPAYTVVENVTYSGCPAQPIGTPAITAAYDQGRLGSSTAPADNPTWTAVPPAALSRTPRSRYLADGQGASIGRVNIPSFLYKL
ncbi:hypothetical protein WJX84_002297 [Apatococcus fuscideae]|uniref:EGF-like domain-containing protein n=1 Tax=Apatococcus fuscideae TaxID=2026836 RepID=A0AAW1SJE2_9CHLO